MEFTRETLETLAGQRPCPPGGIGWLTIDAIAAAFLRERDRAEIAEGWSEHWKGEAERLQRELDLANWNHANREAPREQNPELDQAPDLLDPSDGLVFSKNGWVRWSELHKRWVPVEVKPPRKPNFAPERPHESLVWAIYHAAYAGRCSETDALNLADYDLRNWCSRWPEDAK